MRRGLLLALTRNFLAANAAVVRSILRAHAQLTLSKTFPDLALVLAASKILVSIKDGITGLYEVWHAGLTKTGGH